MLFGLPGVGVNVISESHSNELLLLNSEEVNNLPGQNENVGGKSLDGGGGQSGSGSVAVLGQPSDVEANSDEGWHEEEEGDSWFPPWNSDVHELEVSLQELVKGNEEDENSNDDNS